MQPIDDYEYYNDGATGWGGPGARPTATTTAAPPVATGGLTPAAASTTNPSPIGWNPSAAEAMEGYSDDLMDDWNDWMFPEYAHALQRDKDVTSGSLQHFDYNANRMTSAGDGLNDEAIRLSTMQQGAYIPQAQRIISDANAFDRAGYAERGVKTALGDMGAAFQNDREAARMRNAQYGIDPTSGRAMAMDRTAQVMHGANVASAANRARTAAEEIWGKKQLDAMTTGAMLSQNAATIGQLKSQAGGLYSGAAGIRKLGLDASNQAFTNVGDLVGRTSSMYNTAGGLRNDAGNLRLGAYKTDVDSYNTGRQLDTQRYGIDKDFEASKYSTDKNLEGQKYSADRNYQSNANAASANKKSSTMSALGSVAGAAIAFF